MKSMWVVLVVSLLLCGGCIQDKVNRTIAPAYAGKITTVKAIGVAGPGASLASQELIAQGYKVVEVGAGTVPFVATVDGTDTSQAVWSGFFTFSMRVAEMPSGNVVWSTSGTFGSGGLVIDQQGSTRKAMKAFVTDFAKSFPPEKPPATGPAPEVNK